MILQGQETCRLTNKSKREFLAIFNVRYWPKADVTNFLNPIDMWDMSNVRYRPKADGWDISKIAQIQTENGDWCAPSFTVLNIQFALVIDGGKEYSAIRAVT